MKTIILLGLWAAGVATAQISPSAGASLSLKPTYGGAIMVGRVIMPRNDDLTGVWSSLGRARLMKCAPRCQVVPSLPVQTNLVLNADSLYRIVLGGKFTPNQKVSLVLRFRQGLVMNAVASVSR